MSVLPETAGRPGCPMLPVPVGPEPTRGAIRGGYTRAYRIAAAEPGCVLQRVRVHIRYRCGGVVLADYRQTYWEFFDFARPGAAVVDTHDFDVSKDGWRQSVILGLLKRYRAAVPEGEPVLDVRKSFVLASGTVSGVRSSAVADGVDFGFLAAGPDGPSRTVLRIARGDGTAATVPRMAPCPAGYAVAGEGRHAATTGLRAFEHFGFAFATLRGSFRDRGNYRSTSLAPSPLSTRTT